MGLMWEAKVEAEAKVGVLPVRGPSILQADARKRDGPCHALGGQGIMECQCRLREIRNIQWSMSDSGSVLSGVSGVSTKACGLERRVSLKATARLVRWLSQGTTGDRSPQPKGATIGRAKSERVKLRLRAHLIGWLHRTHYLATTCTHVY